MPPYMSVVKHGFRRGIRIVMRGKEWRSAVLPLFGIFLLLYILVFSFLVLQQEKTYVLQNDYVRLEIRDGVSDQKVHEFYTTLQQLPSVSAVLYVTRENTLEHERERNPDLIAFLEEFGLENPFPDVVSVRLRSPQHDPSFRRFLEEDGWQEIIDLSSFSQGREDQRVAHTFLNMLTFMETLLTSAILVTVLTILLTLVPITRSFTRDDPSFLHESWEQRAFQLVLTLLVGMVGSLCIGGVSFLLMWALFPLF